MMTYLTNNFSHYVWGRTMLKIDYFKIEKEILTACFRHVFIVAMQWKPVCMGNHMHKTNIF